MTLKNTLHKPAFLLLFVLFFSCAKQGKAGSFDSNYDGNTPRMQPSTENYPKLDANYVNSKRNSIDRFCEKYWKSENSNFSFLVAKNGQIIYERYQGKANIENKIPITNETPMHIASVSKVLTATAILLLIDSKKIDLDQKVNTILNKFPFPQITIKTLLDHRSGLRNYSYFTEDKGVWDRKKTLTNQDILNLFTTKNIQLECPTNTRFTYCNTNYAVLALVIEKITGLNYREAMQEMIFKPLGMKNTYVFNFDTDRKTATPSYKGNSAKIGFDYLDCVYGDKNIYSTPQDLLKFDRARNASTFLNPTLRNEIFKGYSNEHKGTKNYGLGIRLIEWETGQKFYFHNGWWHGNTSSYITLDKDKVTIIALSNKFSKNVYAVRKLSPLFGDYPFKLEDGEKEE